MVKGSVMLSVYGVAQYFDKCTAQNRHIVFKIVSVE
jgi:hypothetical protein